MFVFGSKGCVIVNGHKIDLDKLPKQSSEQETKVTKTFTGCDSLYLEDLPGRIFVMSGEREEIQVEISGAKSLVEDVEMEAKHGAVVLCYRGKENWSGGSTTIVGNNIGGIIGGIFGRTQTVINSGRGRQCISSDGVTIISDGDNVAINTSDSLTTVTKVTLPPSMKVVYYGGVNSELFVVGKRDGELELNVRFDGNATVEAAKDVRVRAEGSGDVTIGRLDGGQADLEVRGSGDIWIKGGDVTNLRAQVAGSGDIRAMITAVDADLTVTGSGDIKVSRVTGRLSERCRGSGDIDVYSR